MQYPDWGERSSRWAGIRSETVDVRGTSVHLLRAGGEAGTPPDSPAQLLIHPVGGTGSMWLDVMRPLSAHGPVVAPDLPGTVTGHTGLPRRNAARPDINARFLRAFATTLDLDHVVVHGWSTGGLVALLFADLDPERLDRLVLVDPTLPGPLTAGERLGWQTLGRLGLLLGPPVVHGILRLLGPRLLDLKQRLSDPQALSSSRLDVAGGDLSRLSPEITTLLGEERQQIRSQPRRLSGAVTTFTSAVSAMYVDRRPIQEAIDRVAAPALLLWGDQDPLIRRAVVDGVIARRPDWDLHVFRTVGHLPPLEVPEAYAESVGRWLVQHRERREPRRGRFS